MPKVNVWRCGPRFHDDAIPLHLQLAEPPSPCKVAWLLVIDIVPCLRSAATDVGLVPATVEVGPWCDVAEGICSSSEEPGLYRGSSSSVCICTRNTIR